MALENHLPQPASVSFIQRLHREFYRDAPEAILLIRGEGQEFLMRPGEWRSRPGEDVAVGRYQPPSSAPVDDFNIARSGHGKTFPLICRGAARTPAASHSWLAYNIGDKTNKNGDIQTIALVIMSPR
jgi:hypothetical protein